MTPPAAAARVALAKPSHCVRPGLVDVHVRVDQARQQDHVVVQLDHLGGGQPGVERLDRDDPAAGHADAARRLGAVGDDTARPHDEVELPHLRTSSPPRPPYETRASPIGT